MVTIQTKKGRHRITFYRWFGIDPEASRDQIKKAYRKLARRYHPDVAPAKMREQAEANFKILQGAWDILSDAEKRGRYDEQIGIRQPMQRAQQIIIHWSGSGWYGSDSTTTSTTTGW